MKTQVFKNSEASKSSNSMMVLTMIIFGTIFLIAASKMHLQFGSSSSTFRKQYENEQLLLKMNQPENAVIRDNNAIDIATADLKISMEKMYEYLIPEIEPELEVDKFKSMSFPEFEPVILTSESILNNDHFLKNLKIQAKENTDDAVDYYALEKKVKEYLNVETEQPLKLENWMTDENCLCPEKHVATAFSEVK